MPDYSPRAPIGVLYEHPEWFRPLFEELDRRGFAHEPIDATRLVFDPSDTSVRYSLVVNRASPSSWLRGSTSALLSTLEYLRHVEDNGVSVVNGSTAYGFEISKARQIALMARLGIRHPKSRVITNPMDAKEAAHGLEYPVLVKPNVGGSGAGIASFDDADSLGDAAAAGRLEFGPDHTAVVQEHLPAAGDAVVRVEFLNGRFLYAIRLRLFPGTFNLCPADYCDLPGVADGEAADEPVVSAFTPPAAIVDDARRLLAATGADLGGVEYLTSARDGRAYFYDVNILSNFVADAPNIVGFDPFVDLVDYIVDRADTSQLSARRADVPA